MFFEAYIPNKGFEGLLIASRTVFIITDVGIAFTQIECALISRRINFIVTDFGMKSRTGELKV